MKFWKHMTIGGLAALVSCSSLIYYGRSQEYVQSNAFIKNHPNLQEYHALESSLREAEENFDRYSVSSRGYIDPNYFKEHLNFLKLNNKEFQKDYKRYFIAKTDLEEYSKDPEVQELRKKELAIREEVRSKENEQPGGKRRLLYGTLSLMSFTASLVYVLFTGIRHANKRNENITKEIK